MERERGVREKILAYTEKHPNKLKAESIEKMKSETGARGQADLARATAALSIEQTGPNTYRVDPKGLDIVMSQHKSAARVAISMRVALKVSPRHIHNVRISEECRRNPLQKACM